VRYYRAAPDDDGTLAGRDLRRARGYVDYADKLSGAPGERRHREDAGELRVLSLNQPMEARLGARDREMARDLDGSSAGAYNDLFQFTLTEPMRTEIVLLCDPCRPHLTLTGAEGEKLEGDAAGYTNRSRIRRDLEAGTYSSGPARLFVGMSASTRSRLVRGSEVRPKLRGGVNLS
jgi:hypothetical protein